jgi:hypothetical protein
MPDVLPDAVFKYELKTAGVSKETDMVRLPTCCPTVKAARNDPCPAVKAARNDPRAT